MKHCTKKKITIILIVLILFNFILPTISQASEAVEKIAGGLFLAISKFLRHVGDLLMKELQGYFVNDFTIKVGDKYKIKYSPGIIFSGEVASLDINFFNPKSSESSGATLQPLVATWYKTLRAIALVGLLSVLVYIGIRILISGTSQEKAKYKKMIGGWLAAICLLFILQYIMICILEISERITKMLSANVVGSEGQDILMSNVRDKLEGADSVFTQIFPELVIYIVLIVHTIRFTIQYLKRLLYMAFFTLIAPLIALTYPLDKIKDGKAQAFTIWLREYIFNALLQPMHLLLYYVLVITSSEVLDENNWVFSIVAIGFLIPAEKFFRKMFGFDQAESSGQMGAAAGGALVMNAINNATKKIGKSSTQKPNDSGSAGGNSGGGSSKGTPRYIQGPGQGSGGANSAGNARGGNPARNVSRNTGGNSAGNTNGITRGNLARTANGNATFGQTVKPAGQRGKRSIRNGAATLVGHYNPLNKANRGKILKGTGRIARKAIVGAAGAATLGTVGLAIGTATGDASKALGYAGAGAGAGFMAANNLGDRAAAFEKKNREMYKEGAVGTEEYNTRSSVKELTNDNDFNRTCKTLGVKDQKGREEIIRQFHSNGIKNSEDIKKAINIRVKTGASQDEIIAAYKIKKQADREGLRRDNIEKRLKRQGIEGNELKQAMDIIDML